MLYLLLTLLALLAAAIVAVPLLRNPGRPGVFDRLAVNRALYHQRMDEMQFESVDEELVAEMRAELDASLLADAAHGAAHGAAPGAAHDESSPLDHREHRVWIYAAALLVPLLGTILYLQTADPGLAELRGAETVLALPAMEHRDELETWGERLTRRVDAHADDSKSWYLLAHVHLKLSRYAKAAEAFAMTNTLMPEDLSVQVYWLQARYLAARGVLDDVSRTLARQILTQQPNIPVVLEILALDAVRQGDRGRAIELLNRAASGATDAMQQASFAAAIRELRVGFADAPPGITVAISAAATPPEQATVFVVARPVGGGMPFAAVRRPAVLLPFDVRLDDLVSMSEERKLSAAKAFEVVVRLSRSGNAAAQDGDWEWRSPPLSALDGVTLEARIAPPAS